jgi:rhamnulose-1-phosphate aldolase
MWAMHGIVAVGDTIAETFDLIDTLNKAGKMILQCRSAGQNPIGLSDAQLAELSKAFV